jgi:glyoxylase-like metal-dependent hydrolase (beta-lactamase superfamily II)/rhodanese-related sulfurtransferase
MRGLQMHRFRLLAIALFICLCVATISYAEIKDDESATHDTSAAEYSIEAVYSGKNFKIIQFNLLVLSHFSYLIESNGKVLAVDPGRDIDVYLEYAQKNNLEWVGTFLTHSHADFVAGHREMNIRTGTPIYAGHQSGALYPHFQVKENDKIEVGNAVLKIIETPGHTPDGLCAVVSEKKSTAPDFILTGDTIFVGGVGRPDLMEGTFSAAELAEMLFNSWNNKLSKLPDSTVVLPAHGAGSLCGAKLSDEPSSTIGQEKASNPYLKLSNNKSAFISKVLSGLSKAPGYFGENARINREGPAKVNWEKPYKSNITDFNKLSEKGDFYVVDIREPAEYSAEHIPNSVNISLRGRFETWTGIIIPWDSELIITGNKEDLKEAGKRLQRVGYQASSVLFEDYKVAGGKLIAGNLIEPGELYKKMKSGKAPIIVDVRLPKEWIGMKIGEVVNIPLNVLEQEVIGKLNPKDEIVAVCNSAFRSSLAIGLFERKGFKKVSNLKGGAEAWTDSGYPVIKAAALPHTEGSKETKEFYSLGLPERIDPKDLIEMSKDLPGTFELIDIRTKEQVEDYNPLNAVQVDISLLIDSQLYLAGEVPLVIVDRDGTLAMMVGGILSRKTKRPIKVLRGGMEAFWKESEADFTDTTINIPVKTNPAPTVSPKKDEALPKIKRNKKKRKSAGC